MAVDTGSSESAAATGADREPKTRSGTIPKCGEEPTVMVTVNAAFEPNVQIMLAQYNYEGRERAKNKMSQYAAGTRFFCCRKRLNRSYSKRLCTQRIQTGCWRDGSELAELRGRNYSRRRTSPRPTSWSLIHRRYLKEPDLVPGRGGPVCRRMPAGA